MKISVETCRRFANVYLQTGRNLETACEQVGLSKAQGYYLLSMPEAADIVGQQDIVEELVAAVARAEWLRRTLQLGRQLFGEVAVPMIVTDRDGNIVEHEARKFHPADVRAYMSDMAKIGGLMKQTELTLNLKTVTFDMSGVDEEPELAEGAGETSAPGPLTVATSH